MIFKMDENIKEQKEEDFDAFILPEEFQDKQEQEKESEESYQEDEGEKEQKEDLNNTEENKEKEKEETETEIQSQRSFILELRGLLNNYPLSISLKESNNYLDMAENIVKIYQILKHCKYKSTKEKTINKIEEELELINKIDIKSIQKEVLDYKNTEIGKNRKLKQIQSLLEDNIELIEEKVQSYILSLPIKTKQGYPLKNLHGLPGASAEEYESSEISGGQKIPKDSSFKLGEEGEVIPL